MCPATPGYTDPVKFTNGNPYSTTHVNGRGAVPVDVTARAAAVYQGKRVATITAQFRSARPWAGHSQRR